MTLGIFKKQPAALSMSKFILKKKNNTADIAGLSSKT